MGRNSSKIIQKRHTAIRKAVKRVRDAGVSVIEAIGLVAHSRLDNPEGYSSSYIKDLYFHHDLGTRIRNRKKLGEIAGENKILTPIDKK